MSEKSYLEAWGEVTEKINRLKSRRFSWEFEGDIKHAILSFVLSGGKEILEALPDEIINIWNTSEAKAIKDKKVADKNRVTVEQIK